MRKYYFLLPVGLCLKDIEKVKEKIEYALNNKVIIGQEGKKIAITVLEEIPSLIPYHSFKCSQKLGIPIGYSYEGLITLDMASDSHCYLLVGGYQGTGKSNFLNQAIYHITQNYSPEEIKLILIDLKYGVELAEWEGLPHVVKVNFESKSPALEKSLLSIQQEIRRRMKIFRQVGVRKISEYHKLGNKMPYLMLIIDEYSYIDNKLEEEIKNILQIGRAAGIRAIIATQRPTTDNISGSIKALCADRLCFRVTDALNSRVILDTDGAEKLPAIPGRALFLSGADIKEVQVMLYQEERRRKNEAVWEQQGYEDY